MTASNGKITAQITLHSLPNSDGSVTYVAPNSTHTIIAGVNYPVEVPYRSDEIPESTVIQVNLRPHNGVGMVKERHVEHLISQTLRSAVLGDETPRTMLQVTLQVTNVQIDETLPGGMKDGGQGESYLNVLVGGINTAVLGCLDAGVQMKTVVTAGLIGLTRDGQLLPFPKIVERKRCKSLHAFAYAATGEMILMESEGRFSTNEWLQAEILARQLTGSVLDSIRIAVEQKYKSISPCIGSFLPSDYKSLINGLIVTVLSVPL